jgi:hypothetical protein
LTAPLLLTNKPCLLCQVGCPLRGAFDLAVEHRSVVLAGAAPDRQAQLEELLAGLLVDFKALTLLHLLGELPDQLRRQLDSTVKDGGFGILGRLGVPEVDACGLHQT